ncbi:universal stress protein [Paraflavisolibacter sp. H34]|uniref:universal stress protein n=1 Tax=Huijunlia imazamoxiresistens TaxID=3127457 RepID=UPI00301AC142
MKPIIIPTDFSSSADNAAHFGAQLASALGSTLYLLNVYQIPVSISDIPVMMISGEELKKNADEGLERSREELQKTYPELAIVTESRLGDVTTELKDFCREVDPLAVLIGSHEESGFERLLFGSTTLSVIRHLQCPVMAIPAASRFAPVRNVVFATDLQALSPATALKIVNLTQLFSASLHIVHVDVGGEDPAAHPPGEQVKKLENQLQPLQAVFHEIKDGDVGHGMQSYAEQNQADLIIAVQHKHSFWERFLWKDHCESVLTHVQVPLLVLPE